MLALVRRVFFGVVNEPTYTPSSASAPPPPSGDLCWREIAALVPLAVFVVWIGIQPRFFLDRMQPTLNPVADAVAEHWPTSSTPAADTTAESDPPPLDFAAVVAPQSPPVEAQIREQSPRVR